MQQPSLHSFLGSMRSGRQISIRSYRTSLPTLKARSDRLAPTRSTGNSEKRSPCASAFLGTKKLDNAANACVSTILQSLSPTLHIIIPSRAARFACTARKALSCPDRLMFRDRSQSCCGCVELVHLGISPTLLVDSYDQKHRIDVHCVVSRQDIMPLTFFLRHRAARTTRAR